MELNELANRSQTVKQMILELKSQKELVLKLVKQEISGIVIHYLFVDTSYLSVLYN